MKKFRQLVLISMLLLSLSCSIMYEGIVFSDDEQAEKLQTATAIAEQVEQLTSGASLEPSAEPPATTVPFEQPGSSSSAGTSDVTGDLVEYAVSAVNNGCTCSTNGNMTLSLEVQGDKLIRKLPDGSSQEFQKVSQDRYQRTYMGYYILVDKIGGKEVETRVDEERHDVIILTGTGFIEEHYQGNEASACCYYTFTSAAP